MTTKAQLAEQAEAIERLRAELKPGDTLRTILRHVSASGMSRSISVVKVSDGETWDLSYLVAHALGRRIDQRHDGVICGGCGMDMGFEVVYALSRALFPDGFDCIDPTGRNCGGSEHVNCRTGKPWPQPHRHLEGGYALPQRWL